jgi:hypothetical protein
MVEQPKRNRQTERSNPPAGSNAYRLDPKPSFGMTKVFRTGSGRARTPSQASDLGRTVPVSASWLNHLEIWFAILA